MAITDRPNLVFRPYSNIQPFTLRDGATYLMQIEALIAWLKNDVVPHLDKEVSDITASWHEQVTTLIESWEQLSVDLVASVEEASNTVAADKLAAEAAKLAAEAARDLAEQFASDAAEIQDVAVSNAVNNIASLTRIALEGIFVNSGELSDVVSNFNNTIAGLNLLYPVYRLWDGAQYPEHVDGALNIFVGSVDPGLDMQPGDLWANPDVVTLDDVTLAVLETGNPLRVAIANLVSADVVNLRHIIVGGTSTVGVTVGAEPNSQAGHSLQKATSNQAIKFSGTIPKGWHSARFCFSWITDAAAVGESRLRIYNSVVASNSVPRNGFTTVSNRESPAPGYSKTEVINTIQVNQNDVFQATILRLAGSSTDTLEGGTIITSAWLERAS